jgi:hypothetical protein
MPALPPGEHGVLSPCTLGSQEVGHRLCQHCHEVTTLGTAAGSPPLGAEERLGLSQLEVVEPE